MFDLKGINKVIAKLKNTEEPGTITYEDAGRKEIRCSYELNGKMAFTFGLTRGSRAKSKKYYYVPRQMGITNKNYRKLHDCPWEKQNYNKELIKLKIV
jgi:hypothetical protein